MKLILKITGGEGASSLDGVEGGKESALKDFWNWNEILVSLLFSDI